MLRITLSAGLSLLISSLATAQDQGSTGNITRSFDPDEFARFAPRSALDMVQQIPGFTLDNDNDGGARGFGQASGNILINGQRVSGKSNGATDALSRIAAENVERIDIVDGASLDIPGLSGQVANVIATASEGISGNWSWEGRVREVASSYFDGFEVSASAKTGNVEWSFGIGESTSDARGRRN